MWQMDLVGFVAALFFARFYIPAESAAQGETLWIASLWLVCAAVWMAGRWCRVFPRIRLDYLDAAVGLWIGSQIISGLVIVATTGDKRSAMNLTWEWVALAALWFIARYAIVVNSARRGLLLAMIVTGTVLAGYGLYQHYVSHRQMAAEYGPLFDQLRTATGSEAASIRQRLSRDGIPTEGPALILFEKRLRDSTEPLGLFALANTFGGCLAVCLILAIGELWIGRQHGSPWRSLVPLLIAIAIIGWCLLLTKSRTAVIGTACGLVMLAVSRVSMSASLRRLVLPASLAIGVMAVAVTALFAAGGLDRQVLSEAPKSLAYRFQYWQATRSLIVDHIWLGVGPGNFRQHYLKYKLPEASEEIADPHNMFFDVTATGGIVSGIGLTLLLVLVFLTICRVVGGRDPSMDAAGNDPSDGGTMAYWAAACGAALAFVGPYVFLGEWEDRVIVLGLIWCAVAWLMSRSGPQSSPSVDSTDAMRSVSLAAAVTLGVHLLGAGGIGMPGVSQVLILLLAFSVRPVTPATDDGGWRLWPALRLVGILGLLVALVMSSLLPVMTRSDLVRKGSYVESSDSRHRQLARGYLRAATIADSWSAEPWMNLFQWDAESVAQSNESFQAAVEDLAQVRLRDPMNFWAPKTLGTLWMQKWQRSHIKEDAEQAVRWTSLAHGLYPTNSVIWSDLALAYEASGDSLQAAEAARGALAQDAIYHKHGHVDRYLEESVRQRLEKLASKSEAK